MLIYPSWVVLHLSTRWARGLTVFLLNQNLSLNSALGRLPARRANIPTTLSCSYFFRLLCWQEKQSKKSRRELLNAVAMFISNSHPFYKKLNVVVSRVIFMQIYCVLHKIQIDTFQLHFTWPPCFQRFKIPKSHNSSCIPKHWVWLRFFWLWWGDVLWYFFFFFCKKSILWEEKLLLNQFFFFFYPGN